MTSESTRFLGQPREIKPTLGRVRSSVVGVGISRVAEVVTTLHFSKGPQKRQTLTAGDEPRFQRCALGATPYPGLTAWAEMKRALGAEGLSELRQSARKAQRMPRR